VTVFAAGGAAHVLVAVFALLVEGVLRLGSCGVAAVAAGALAGLEALVVAGGAVGDFALVSGVVECDLAHLATFERHLGGAFSHGEGADGEEGHGDQSDNHLFHVSFLLEGVLWCGVLLAHPLNLWLRKSYTTDDQFSSDI